MVKIKNIKRRKSLNKMRSKNLISIKKLKKYIKKYYILIILNMILAMVSSASSVAPIALLKRLIDQGIIGKNEKDILYAAGGMILLSVVGAFIMYWNTLLSGKVSSSIYKNIIDDLYLKLQSLDIEYFSKTKVGEMIGKVIENSELSFDDLDLILKAVEKKRKTAVEEVLCDCVEGQCNCEHSGHKHI